MADHHTHLLLLKMAVGIYVYSATGALVRSNTDVRWGDLGCSGVQVRALCRTHEFYFKIHTPCLHGARVKLCDNIWWRTTYMYILLVILRICKCRYTETLQCPEREYMLIMCDIIVNNNYNNNYFIMVKNVISHCWSALFQRAELLLHQIVDTVWTRRHVMGSLG